MYFRFIVLLFGFCIAYGQHVEVGSHSLDASFFYGNILRHNKDISHLITGHPTGMIFSYNKKTFGNDDWSARYNYPDYGATLIYQDLKNESLGENYSFYGHFNFYALQRNLMVRIGQGVAVASNPFDLDTNFKNNAYGSRLLSSTFLMLNYSKSNLLDGLGLQTGISLIHYSNGNVKAPNSSTNTLALHLGLTYDFEKVTTPEYTPATKNTYTEPIAFNFALRSGVSESDYIGLGPLPFLVVSTFVDKKFNKKSALQAGADFFLSGSLKSEIEYLSIAFPEQGLLGKEDWKRLGIFVGHELRFNKIAFVTQVGYYVYYPYDFEGRVYFRGGLKRYFAKTLFGAVTLKSHAGKAEAVEFGLGFRL